MGGDLDAWIASMRKCELLPEHDLKHLCEYVTEIMLEESTVQPVSSPVTICGDSHGQFHDLLELFRCGGECPETSYIFMVSRHHVSDVGVGCPIACTKLLDRRLRVGSLHLHCHCVTTPGRCILGS